MDPYRHALISAGGHGDGVHGALALTPRKRRSARAWFRSSTRGRYLVAAALILLCAFAVPAMNRAVAKPHAEVLAALRTMPPGHVIEPGDLGPVQAQAPPASVVSAVDAASMLGRTVSAQVPAGALLSPGDLGAYPPSGQSTVPVAVKPGQYPPDLRSGQDVAVFPVAGDAGTPMTPAAHAAATARVVLVQAEPDSASGTVVVELLTSTTQAPVIAQAPAVVLVGLDSAGDLP